MPWAVISRVRSPGRYAQGPQPAAKQKGGPGAPRDQCSEEARATLLGRCSGKNSGMLWAWKWVFLICPPSPPAPGMAKLRALPCQGRSAARRSS